MASSQTPITRPTTVSLTELVPDDTAQLKELLQACDNALNRCEQALESEKERARALEEFNEGQAKRIGELESQVNSFWSSPWLWMAVGAAAGIATGVVISK